ncbi:MAG: hypothetical protein MRZ79_14150 [Bacteroidia bacterium]|nr:hypothetical protein [Bacteroidia bacterium]
MERSTLNQGIDLEALVREKDFQDLSFEERIEVLSEVSEREYQQMRELVIWSGELLGETQPSLVPNANIRKNLNQKFREKKHQNKIIQMLQAPVPVWKVAAATVVLMVSIQFINPRAWLGSSPNTNIPMLLVDSTHLDTSIKINHAHGEDSIYSTFEDSL